MDSDSIALRIDFGFVGNSAQYKIAGWQAPEQGFTWTSGNKSSLAFPRPGLPGRYALELQVSPFVWRNKLSRQRLIITVNDAQVGRFAVLHEAVLTCAIPWTLLTERGVCTVEFQLPDAAIPSEVNGVPDARHLAIAFDELRLLWLG